MSRLTIAIPSKGRLKEQTEAWLASLGHPLRQIGGERGYTAEIGGLDAEVRLLSAREIAQGLIEGSLHFGVTGEDLLHDLAPDGAQDFRVLKRLGFGGADVVVAVPQAWLDVDSMADLEAAGAAFRKAHGRRLRVATKYLRLTRRYFAQKSVGEYRLVESAGATEAAPATGTADVIVDITTTGATLKANGLKVLRDGVILESEAAFTQSVRAQLEGGAQAVADTLVGALARSDHKS
jgi:ATP phosphoribosyltransferase